MKEARAETTMDLPVKLNEAVDPAEEV